MRKQFDKVLAVRLMSRSAIGEVPTTRRIPNKRKLLRKLSKRDLQRELE